MAKTNRRDPEEDKEDLGSVDSLGADEKLDEGSEETEESSDVSEGTEEDASESLEGGDDEDVSDDEPLEKEDDEEVSDEPLEEGDEDDPQDDEPLKKGDEEDDSDDEPLEEGDEDAEDIQSEGPEDTKDPEGPGNEEAQPPGRIDPRDLAREMKQSYLDYSMSVIVGRALPDARDGLKPVHRRILHAMNEMGNHHNKPYKKSARIVGEVLGKYHPHGDSSVYDALVRMTQDFSLRYPLVDGQGNFGSVDGDNAAAMRYTEARLRKIAEELLKDIDKDTVAFGPNFDNTLKEPLVLPSKFPNLLVNGSAGIAVGMATSIPPHNMGEICDAIITIIDDPDLPVQKLLDIVTGPDFPTGAIIRGKKGIEAAYLTGRGKCVVRAKMVIEEGRNRQHIIVNEIPYQVNKSQLIEQIATLVREKRIDGIHDLRDESDRDGMRIVIELKQGANPEIVQNQLYKHSRLQDTFGIILLALVDNRPIVLNLKELIQQFILHRFNVIKARTEFDLRKAMERAHILEGLIIALDHIDDVIALIRGSKDAAEAHKSLMERFGLSDPQSKAILDMRLQKLASLEQQKTKDEHAEIMKTIAELQAILSDHSRIYAIIKEETEEMRESYGDARKTDILEGGDEDYDIDMEDLIDQEDMIITITHMGYIKRLSVDTYREQKRGGKGVKASTNKEEDFIEDLFVANTHDYLLFFTDRGQVHWLKVYRLPEGSRTARGTAIVNLLPLEQGEKVTAFVAAREFREGSLMMATKNGVIKKTKMELFSHPRKGGIRAIILDENDSLIEVKLVGESDQLLIGTKKGKAVKFLATQVRDIGRTARGVRGIRLREDDEVIGMIVAPDDKTVLTLTENGFGKRSNVEEYRLINRGGSGVINIICSDRNGDVVTIRCTDDSDSLVLISQGGIAMRIPASGISVIGRNTQGVRVMRLQDGDKLVGCAKIISENGEDDEGPGDNASGD